MDKLGVSTADCIGYHTGSKIALELALQRPAQIKHLVLISTPVYSAEETAAMRREFSPMKVAADGSHLVEYWNALMQWRGPGQTPEMIMRYYPDHMRGGELRHWGHRAAFNYQYPDTLPRAEQPIMVINTNDDLVQYTPRAAPLLKNGRIVDCMEWGHGFLDLHTAQVGAMLREFLDA
jgi:pimeloyl-ACP methyl ester carboxylesterase